MLPSMLKWFFCKRILSFFLFFMLASGAKSDDIAVSADLARIDLIAGEIRQIIRPESRTQHLHSELLGLALRGCNSSGCAIDDRIRQRFLRFILDKDDGGRWVAATAFLKLEKAACPILADLKEESEREEEEFQLSRSVSTGNHFRYKLRLTVGELDAICMQP